MQYLNFKNEPESGNRVAMALSSEDLLKKKESYWLLGLVVTLIVIGSIVFYSAHTGGRREQIVACVVFLNTEQPPQTFSCYGYRPSCQLPSVRWLQQLHRQPNTSPHPREDTGEAQLLSDTDEDISYPYNSLSGVTPLR